MLKFLIAAIMMLVFTACGQNNEQSAPTTETSTSQVAPYLQGTWAMADGTDEFNMVAGVHAGTIEITWVSDGTKALYWRGTFDVPANVENGTKISSKADKKALASSILGSQDDVKVFTYEDDTLSYDFTVMGTTKTITLTR